MSSRSSRYKKKPQVKTFEFKIPKESAVSPISDVEEWIGHDVKGRWEKKELSKYVIYIFYSLDDAFNFKLKWALS